MIFYELLWGIHFGHRLVRATKDLAYSQEVVVLVQNLQSQGDTNRQSSRHCWGIACNLLWISNLPGLKLRNSWSVLVHRQFSQFFPINQCLWIDFVFQGLRWRNSTRMCSCKGAICMETSKTKRRKVEVRPMLCLRWCGLSWCWKSLSFHYQPERRKTRHFFLKDLLYLECQRSTVSISLESLSSWKAFVQLLIYPPILGTLE